MADNPLGNLKLPYDYSQGDPDAPKAATTAPAAQPTIINSGNAPATAPAPAPITAAPTPSHPDLDKIKLPYSDNQTPAAATDDDSGDSPLWTALNKPTTSISDLADAARLTGRGVYDAARVWGNQAIVPHGFDRLMAQIPGSADFATQAAETERAKKDLGSFTGPVEWAGQNYSLPGVANRLAGGSGVVSQVANNPITTGVVTGGGGTVAGGDYNPVDILKNAATTALESKAGQAIGSAGSVAAGWLGNTGKSLYQKAQDEASAALNASDIPGWTAAMQKAASVRALQGLHSLYSEGGDVIGKARDLANQTTGAASEAYNKIADAASQETGVGKWADRLITGSLGALTGGETAGAVAIGANELANRINKVADVRSAIDQAFPTVTSYVKSAVDPQNWRNAMGNAAVVAGNDYEGLRNRAANFSITGALHNIPGASYLGY
jgi:hypothetical protein